MPFVATAISSLAFVVMGSIFFFLDLRVHEGVSFFKRRSVLRAGVAAPARILADKMLNKSVARTGTPRSAYAIDYEVLPPGAPPFRAHGVEVLTMLEDRANLQASRRGALDGTDVTVPVRFDPKSNVVVLVRADTAAYERDVEARRQEAKESLRKLNG
jgi:hypothetical protein